jgi:hypothetical protein
MFTAIVGRFLTSLAAWRLECGVEVAAVEYLAGSRTVFGTISTPFRLKLLHRTLPVLLVLWSLSPLGGQASLRVVYPGPMNYTVPISYTNSLTPSEKIRGGAAQLQAVKSFSPRSFLHRSPTRVARISLGTLKFL